jgi:hypothetical protein
VEYVRVLVRLRFFNKKGNLRSFYELDFVLNVSKAGYNLHDLEDMREVRKRVEAVVRRLNPAWFMQVSRPAFLAGAMLAEVLTEMIPKHLTVAERQVDLNRHRWTGHSLMSLFLSEVEVSRIIG